MRKKRISSNKSQFNLVGNLPKIPHFASEKSDFCRLFKTKIKSSKNPAKPLQSSREYSIQKTKTAGLLGNRQYD